MPPSHAHRWMLLATVAAGLLLITLDNSVLYTALPTLTRELGATPAEGLWIINTYPLVMAGLLLGSGTLGDRFGHRKMFLIGLVLFGAASLIAAYAPTPLILIGARAFLAVGAAAMMPATLALIRVTFEDEQERNLAMAIWGSLAVIGAALGPIIGGLLLEHFWWGSVFLVNVPVVIAAFVATWMFAPKVEADRKVPWDILSSLQALIALSAFVVVIKQAVHDGDPWIAVAALAVAVLAGAVFVRRQLHLSFPLLDFSIFRNAAFMSGVLAAALSLFAVSGLQLTTTQRFQLVSAYSPLEAGLLVSTVAIGSLPTAVLGGALLHRIGLRILISGGLGAGALAVLVVAYGASYGLGWLVLGLLLTGGSLGAAMSVASTAIVGNAPVHRAGMASSVEEVSYEFGSLFSVSILGSLLAALYTSGLSLPEGTPEIVRNSIGDALSYAEDAGPKGQSILDAAGTAFDQGYTITLYVVSAVLMAGAITTGILLRAYGPGTKSSSYPT